MKKRLAVIAIVLVLVSLLPSTGIIQNIDLRGRVISLKTHANPWVRKGDTIWSYHATTGLLDVKVVANQTIEKPTARGLSTRFVLRSPMKIVEVTKPHIVNMTIPTKETVMCYHVTLSEGPGNEYVECIFLPCNLKYKNEPIRIVEPGPPRGIQFMPPPFSGGFFITKPKVPRSGHKALKALIIKHYIFGLTTPVHTNCGTKGFFLL